MNTIISPSRMSIREMADMLKVTPEEVRYCVRHFDMPLNFDDFALWCETKPHITIQLISGKFKTWKIIDKKYKVEKTYSFKPYIFA